MYKSKDDENISRTMQDKKMEQKKSGIYMDRMDGALPQSRVSKYYQDTNPKMEQTAETFKRKGGTDNYIADGIKSAINEVIDIDKDGDTVFDDKNQDGNMFTRGAKKLGKFIKSFDDRAQPSNNINRR